MSLDLSDRYFAAGSRLNIGGKLVDRVEKYTGHSLVRQIDQRLFSAWRYYFGYDADGFHATSTISRAGSQGELAAVRVNHSRALVNALLNLIVAPNLVWTPRAANIDYDSIRQTELAASVLEHYWHNKGVKANCTRAVEEAIAFTEGFILVEWDDQMGAVIPGVDEKAFHRTGDIRYTNISSWDVIRDPDKKSWDELDWVMVRVWRNKYDLAARYQYDPGVDVEEILGCPADIDSRRTASLQKWDTDDIPVYMFYHKPSSVLPFGREVHFLPNKTVLKYGNLDDGQFPIHRIAAADLLGTPFGYTQFFEILGIQELSDSIHSIIASNITTFGAQCVTAEEDSPLQVDELAGGMRVIYHKPGGQPPAPLQLTKSPEEAFKYLGDLKTHQELLMGLNAVVRGEAQSDRLSGSALLLLQSQAIQQASTLQGNYLRTVQNLGSTTIRLVRTKATSPLKISIVGKHKLNLVQETEVTGDQIKSVSEVFVEIGNPIAQTTAGRYEIAQLLVQMPGAIQSPEQLQNVLDYGRLDSLTQGNKEELLNILRENQDIAKGILPRAMLHDNHLLHGQEHKVTVATPSARRDPAIIEAYTEHMHEHYSLFFGVPLEAVTMDPLYRDRMLLLSGQTPPPPMMTPGMMGPGMPPGGQGAPQGPPPPAPKGPNPLAPPEAVQGPQAGMNARPPTMPNMPAPTAPGQPNQGNQ